MRPVPIKMYVLLIWPCGAGKVRYACFNLPLIVCHLHSQEWAKPRAHAAVMEIKVSDAATVLCYVYWTWAAVCLHGAIIDLLEASILLWCTSSVLISDWMLYSQGWCHFLKFKFSQWVWQIQSYHWWWNMHSKFLELNNLEFERPLEVIFLFRLQLVFRDTVIFFGIQHYSLLVHGYSFVAARPSSLHSHFVASWGR